MWLFLVLETVLSALILWHGSAQFSGVYDFIQNASEWELAGSVMLSAFFLHGPIVFLGRAFELVRRLQRRLRRSIPQPKALENVKQNVPLQPTVGTGDEEVAEGQPPRKAETRDKNRQQQAQSHSRFAQGSAQFA